jgi:signal transduction histidine kinase
LQPLPRTTPARRRVHGDAARDARLADSASEELGRFLARELHDSVAQTLTAMLLELENFRRDQYGRAGALSQIDVLEQSTRSALADLRTLLVELRARQRAEEDLVLLIRRGMLERQQHNRSVEFQLHVVPEWPARISSGAATHLYRIACEAIDNALRHGAPTKVEVALSLREDMGSMTITDDGLGIKKQPRSKRRPGFGIIGMSERAELLGGTVSLQPGAQSRGTAVQVIFPLHPIPVIRDDA